MAASRVRSAECAKVALGLIAAFMILTAPQRAYCQDTLCLHFDSQSSGIRLRLERGYLINGVLPMTVCDLRSGESWKLVADGHGLETKFGRLSLDAGGRPAISGSRMGMMMKNALVPGAGSIARGRTASGLMDLGLVVTSGYYWLTEQFEYSDMEEEYDRLVERRSEASTYEEISRFEDALHYSSRALNVQNDHRKRALILFSAAYAGQLLLDPLLFGGPPGWSAGSGGSVISVEVSRRNRAKAFMYSMIWPGKGQFYQGKTTRGVLITSLATAAGIYALDRINSYDEHSFRYEIEIDKWEASLSPEEREYHASRAGSIWSDLDEIKKERNTALALLGGIWGLGLLDTFFPREEDTSATGAFSVQAGPGSFALVIDF